MPLTPPTQPPSLPSQLNKPIIWLLAAWVLGSILGQHLSPSLIVIPTALAILFFILALLAQLLHRPRFICITLLLVSFSTLAAAWFIINDQYTSPNNLSRYMTTERQLVDLEGLVDSEVTVRLQPGGSLGRFMYSPPSTRFNLNVNTIHTRTRPITVHGSLMVSLDGIDLRLRPGDRIRCQGWLNSTTPPTNLGQFDYAAAMKRQHIVGWLSLADPGNWQPATPSSSLIDFQAAWTRIRGQMSSITHNALLHDTSSRLDPDQQGFLDAVVLGRRTDLTDDIETAFRRTGLAHILAVSGLHVGILAAGAWWLISIATGRPRAAALTALAAVLLYILIVPARPPILRAAFMTAAFCSSLAIGRRSSALAALASAALILLIIQPLLILDAGFQLTFTVVASLILFTTPVAQALRQNDIRHQLSARPSTLQRLGCDYLAVSLVASLAAFPLVAFHFQMVNPLSFLASILAMPCIFILLWLSFLKIILTLLIPPLSSLLAIPLAAIVRFTLAATDLASHLPASYLFIPTPSAWWTITTLTLILASFTSLFRHRRLAQSLAILICITWLYAPIIARHLPTNAARSLHLTMLSVGNGSCYVVQQGPSAFLFDCGSASHSDLARSTISPALRSLSITRLDAIILSHPDLDHFAALPELLQDFPVQQIILTRDFLEDADYRPWAAPAAALQSVHSHNIPIRIAASNTPLSLLPHASTQIIWPPANHHFKTDNDASIVLAIQAFNRRILLCGDIQQDALAAILNTSADWHADVTDLPHHGSFVPASPDWLARVNPSIVLQSAAPSRLARDPWPQHLASTSRYITANQGMISLTIAPDSHISVHPFLNSPPSPDPRESVSNNDPD